MHALDNITAVVEYSSNVLRVDGTREVGVAVMPTVGYRYFLYQCNSKTKRCDNAVQTLVK